MKHKMFHHGEKGQMREMFAVLGECFASASIRRELGRPMTSADGYIWFVALDTDTVAGFAALRFAKNGNAELCHAYTFPEHRRQGINGCLTKMRIEQAILQGAKKISATIDPARIGKYPGFERDISRGRWLVIKKIL